MTCILFLMMDEYSKEILKNNRLLFLIFFLLAILSWVLCNKTWDFVDFPLYPYLVVPKIKKKKSEIGSLIGSLKFI